ncbi:hypothetical protein [Paenibacillus gansuensis]|uniref:Uncharacterized protein n=1 Tax=Paenibacillus gansuensis TaxID=306542 RepID=A0ABW5PFP0_9BACL
MNLQDTLFNWLQIKLVCNARPEDRAAAETRDFFELMLREDHHVGKYEIERMDDTMVYVVYETGDSRKKKLIDREEAFRLLHDITENPKYNE